MQTQKHRPTQTAAPKQKQKQSVGQIVEHTAMIRMTPRQFQKKMEARGLIESVSDRPEHVSLDISSSYLDRPLDQREWREETDPSHKTSKNLSTGEEAHTLVMSRLHASGGLTDYLEKEFAPDLTGKERTAFNAILAELDQKTGLLKAPVPDIAETSGIASSVLEIVLTKLKQCDPQGIGCESKEHYRLFCLELAGKEKSNEYKLLEAHLTHPTMRPADIADQLADELELEEDDLAAVFDEVKGMPTHPWTGMHNQASAQQGAVIESPEDVAPEIRFVKLDEKWSAKLLRDSLSRCKLTDHYEHMIEKHSPRKLKAKLSRTADEDETTHTDTLLNKLDLLEKVIRALPVSRDKEDQLKNLREDRADLRAWRGSISAKKRLADYVAEQQTEFFESGCDWTRLRPLGRKRVAEAVRIHPTRVSSHIRGCCAVVEKERGGSLLLPLYALIAGSEADTGAIPQNFDATAAKEREPRALIQRFMDAESANHRVTDDILFVMLQGCGHYISRQWVASRRSRLGYPDIQFSDEKNRDETPSSRTQSTPRDWTVAEAEGLLKRLKLPFDKKRMEAALRGLSAGGETDYNPFAANTLLRELASHEPPARSLSAAHFAVMLNALGFTISRKWTEGAILSKPDKRRTTEEVVKFPAILRPAGRAANWTAEELSGILKKAGYPPDLEKVKAAYEKIIIQERVSAAERQRMKRRAVTHRQILERSQQNIS